MDKLQTVTQNEWHIMELLWQAPRTLMELVSLLAQQQGWAKSTVTTMVRRMDTKGLITYTTQGRTKVFAPAVSREDAILRETSSLLQKAYNGSVGLLVSAMAHRNELTKADIDELYAILKEAEAKQP
jgi:BlaI family penicillinase repressor